MSDRSTLRDAQQRQLWSDLPIPEQPRDGWVALFCAWLYRWTCAEGATTARERVLLDKFTAERERRRDAETDQQALLDRIHVLQLNVDQLTTLVELANARVNAQVTITERLAGVVRPK